MGPYTQHGRPKSQGHHLFPTCSLSEIPTNCTSFAYPHWFSARSRLFKVLMVLRNLLLPFHCFIRVVLLLLLLLIKADWKWPCALSSEFAREPSLRRGLGKRDLLGKFQENEVGEMWGTETGTKGSYQAKSQVTTKSKWWCSPEDEGYISALPSPGQVFLSSDNFPHPTRHHWLRASLGGFESQALCFLSALAKQVPTAWGHSCDNCCVGVTLWAEW